MALEVPKSTAIVRLEGREDPTEANQSRRIPRKRPHVPVRDNHAPFDHRAAGLLVPPPAGREHGGAPAKEGLARLRDILSRSRNNGDQALLELPDDEMLSALRMVAMVDGGKDPDGHRNCSRREARGHRPVRAHLGSRVPGPRGDGGSGQPGLRPAPALHD